MNWTVVQRILGLLLMMFSLTMLPPVLVAILFNEGYVKEVHGRAADETRHKLVCRSVIQI